MIIGTYMVQIDIKVADSDFPHKEAAKRTVPLVIAKETLESVSLIELAKKLAQDVPQLLADAIKEMEEK